MEVLEQRSGEGNKHLSDYKQPYKLNSSNFSDNASISNLKSIRAKISNCHNAFPYLKKNNMLF